MLDQDDAVVTRDHDPPPVVRYVDVMLYNMTKRGPRTLTLRSSQPLPGMEEREARADPPFGFVNVLNRLKVIANLTPQRYSEPVAGTIDMRISGKPWSFDVAFDETQDDATCTVVVCEASEPD